MPGRLFLIPSALIIFALVAPASAAPEKTGTIKGKVTFSGKVPPRKIINTATDPGCREHAPPRTEEVVVAKDGSLKNVVIYVKHGLPKDQKFQASTEPVVIDQVGCRYTPHVTAVMVGQPLKVTNSDNTMHNVHGLPFENAGFNVVQQKKGAANVFTFKSPEVPGFIMKCDIHAWMQSYVWVFDHPYFIVSGDDGTYSLPALPPGTYTIGAWQEKCAAQEREVTVKAGETVELAFTFELEKK